MTLSSREKLLAGAAVTAVLLLLAYHFALKPVVERTGALRRTIPEKQNELAQLRQLAGEYELLENDIMQLSRELPEPDADFSPLQFIEQTLQSAGIASWTLSRSQEIEGERVVQLFIEIRIDETGWKELVEFFRGVEAEPSLRLNRIEITRQRGRREGLRAGISVTGLRRPN